MNQKLCGVYKITNLINGKIYVGQSVDIERRWEQHKRIGQGQLNGFYAKDGRRPLYRAINKYGVNSFKFEILELCSEEMLYEREQYWIDLLHANTKNCTGYNLNDGGAGNKNNTQQRYAYQYDLDGNYIGEYESITKATLSMGLKPNSGAIQNAIGVEGKTSCGYQWRYEKLNKISAISYYSKRNKVAMYDKNGKLLKIFANTTEAGNSINKTHSAIEYNCKNKSKYCGGYIFRYFDEKPLLTIDAPKNNPRIFPSKKVGQYTLEGNLIKVYKSAIDAAKELNIDASMIYKCCKGAKNSEGFTYKTYRGFVWKFYKEN